LERAYCVRRSFYHTCSPTLVASSKLGISGEDSGNFCRLATSPYFSGVNFSQAKKKFNFCKIAQKQGCYKISLCAQRILAHKYHFGALSNDAIHILLNLLVCYLANCDAESFLDPWSEKAS